MIRVCFHGAESTGKSTLAQQLADEFGCPLVAEYGRTYAETVSTEFTMDALLTIARAQDRSMRAATAGQPRLALLDTDPLMTAARSQMLFNHVPDEYQPSAAVIAARACVSRAAQSPEMVR